MENRQLSVSEFSFYVSKIFENEILLHNIDIVGEVATFTINGGNIYFQIKDANALLQCVLFGTKNNYLPKIGEKVIVTGSPNYYIKGGRFSFNCSKIKPFGIGDLYKQFEKMKQKLSQEGLFDLDHKKTKPKIIKNIGIVTSKQGAVIQDIINVATRRDPSVNLILFPVKVQGIGSEIEISQGIEFFNNYNVDAVIVARGGGSTEDLAPFNTEMVARATYNSNKFIVSAVGHETDYTIIDYVADLRAPTPSAAAELLTVDKSIEIEKQKQNLHLLNLFITSKLENLNTSINMSYNNIFNSFNQKIDSNNLLVFDKIKAINLFTESKIQLNTYLLEKTIDLLNSSNPKAILKNGYAKIEKNNHNISSIKNLNVNDDLKIIFEDGCLKATIKEIGGN